MNQRNKIVAGILILSTYFFAACQKGKAVNGTAYGLISVSGGVISGENIAPILIEVDGVTLDTLSAKRLGVYGLITHAGYKKLVLRQFGTGRSLFDTSFSLKPGENAGINRGFFYAGGDVYMDDYTVKPDKDSMLVRFINMDPSLPDVINITFGIHYVQSGNKMIPVTGKQVNGITGKDFSQFIQLPNPTPLAPTGATQVRYIIEGYDAVTNQKVMSFDPLAAQANMSWIITNPGTTGTAQLRWTNNLVLTMGIGPRGTSPTSAIRGPKVIFNHIAQ